MLRLAAERANADALGPVEEGRRTIEGEVLGVKLRDTDFGATWKMRLKLEDGSTLYGTVPVALERKILEGAEEYDDVEKLKGHKVRFSATVKAGRENGFGFYSRPTKAEFIN